MRSESNDNALVLVSGKKANEVKPIVAVELACCSPETFSRESAFLFAKILQAEMVSATFMIYAGLFALPLSGEQQLRPSSIFWPAIAFFLAGGANLSYDLIRRWVNRNYTQPLLEAEQKEEHDRSLSVKIPQSVGSVRLFLSEFLHASALPRRIINFQSTVAAAQVATAIDPSFFTDGYRGFPVLIGSTLGGALISLADHFMHPLEVKRNHGKAFFFIRRSLELLAAPIGLAGALVDIMNLYWNFINNEDSPFAANLALVMGASGLAALVSLLSIINLLRAKSKTPGIAARLFSGIIGLTMGVITTNQFMQYILNIIVFATDSSYLATPPWMTVPLSLSAALLGLIVGYANFKHVFEELGVHYNQYFSGVLFKRLPGVKPEDSTDIDEFCNDSHSFCQAWTLFWCGRVKQVASLNPAATVTPVVEPVPMVEVPRHEVKRSSCFGSFARFFGWGSRSPAASTSSDIAMPLLPPSHPMS